jgi:hypothetical protein
VRNAYECKEEFGRDGKCVSRQRAIGPVVVWGLVTIVSLAMGRALVNLPPPSFWDFIRH